MQQQHQFQTLLQVNQLDKNMKKALVVMFCASNAKKEVNIDKNIINAEDYLANGMARDNSLATNQESTNVKP